MVAPTVGLSPVYDGQQFFDNNGQMLSGGYLYSYQAGSYSVAQPTYTDHTGNTANPNPIQLSSTGRVPNGIWIDVTLAYNLVVTMPDQITVLENADYVSAINIAGILTTTNYNSYAPSLTGNAATGNWHIAVTVPAQPAITSVGSLTSLDVLGNVTFDSGTVSSTYNTGALVVIGGVGLSGNLNVGGDITAFSTSDKHLKSNIENIPDALYKVNNINGVTFNWNELSGKDEVTKEAGVIAQELQLVLPEVVKRRENGYLAVRYEQIIPLLIEAIKELSDKVDKLEGK